MPDTSTKKKPVNGAGLHNFIATGGKPADYEGCKGISSETVPNIKSEKSEQRSLKTK